MYFSKLAPHGDDWYHCFCRGERHFRDITSIPGLPTAKTLLKQRLQISFVRTVSATSLTVIISQTSSFISVSADISNGNP